MRVLKKSILSNQINIQIKIITDNHIHIHYQTLQKKSRYLLEISWYYGGAILLQLQYLVDFEEIDLINAEAAHLEKMPDGADGTDAHEVRLAADHLITNDAGER